MHLPAHIHGRIFYRSQNERTLTLHDNRLWPRKLAAPKLAKTILASGALLFLTLCFPVGFSGFPKAPTAIRDHGVFILQVAGRRIGTENFEIRSRGDQVEARAETQIHVTQNGKTFDFKTFPDLILNAALEPIAYTWSQKGSQSSRISINFAKSPVRVRYHTVNGRQDVRTFALPRSVVILDDNVIDQYELVAERYLRTPGGKQTFQAFTPQEALPGVITVSSLGAESLQINGHKQICQHLALSTSLAQIDLWVDKQGQLLRMERASTQFIAFRAR